MGSFEVQCQGITLFSKLELGYFPHVTLLTNRIVTFIEDAERGSDLSSYKYSSPIKHHPTLKKDSSKSPQKTNVTSNLILLPEAKPKKDHSEIKLVEKQVDKQPEHK